MKTEEIIEMARNLAKPFRTSKGKDFRLHSSDPLQAARAWVEQNKVRHRKDSGS